MKNEKDYKYELEVTVSYLNQHQQIKPYVYQVLFEQMLERHLALFKTNVDHTLEYGLAWVMISMSVEILSPINECMILEGSTWYSGRHGPYFRRELLFKNKDGQVMFQGSSHSVLMDLKKRTVFRKKEVPFPMPHPEESYAMESSPNFKTDAFYEPVETRRVMHSHIDCLGHVNNCRYGEFVYDAFSSDEIGDLKDLKKIDMYFHSELRDGDSFTMEKAKDKSQLLFRGSNNTKDDVAFHMVMDFKNRK